MAEFGLVFVTVAMGYQKVDAELELRPRVVEVDLVLGDLPMIVAGPDDAVAVPMLVVAVFLVEFVEPKEVVVVLLAELVEPMEVVLEVFAEVVEPKAAAVEILYGKAVPTDSEAVKALLLGLDPRMAVIAASLACHSCVSMLAELVDETEVALEDGSRVAEHLSEVVLVLHAESRMAVPEGPSYLGLAESVFGFE